MTKGEAQGTRPPKKPRHREEGSATQGEGRSRRAFLTAATIRAAFQKRFPLHQRPILTNVTSHVSHAFNSLPLSS